MKISFRMCRVSMLAFSVSALLTTSVHAHHPPAAKFDDSQTGLLNGKVTSVDWTNPHVHVYVNVEDAQGMVTNWAIELDSRIALEANGWRPDSLATGSQVQASGWLARNGSHQLWANTLQTAEGTAVYSVDEYAAIAKVRMAATGETPRWPDGQPRLGPAPGETGYWTLPNKSMLYEDGQYLSTNAYGQLANPELAGDVAPFQDWAQDLFRYRQANNQKDDPLFLNCIPPGGPRMFQVPYGVQFVEQRERDRIFVLMGGGNGNWRLIYTDDRANVGQVSGNDDNPLFFGRSSAQWQGDTLVITSTGFTEGFWFSNGGLPHTRLMTLTERITRPNLNTLHYAVTIDDAGAYTRPWTSSWDLHWLPGEELPEFYCQDNRP